MRKYLLVLGYLVTIFTACNGMAPKLGMQPRRPPNILFVLTDDQNFDEISVMPNLKTLLIDQGVSFSNYFVSVSLCCPSRTTILRGQYSHNTGVKTNIATNGGFETAYRLGLEQSTVATWLQGKLYHTVLIGKYLNGYPNTVSDTYVPPGWDEWDSPVQGNPYAEFNYVLNENGMLVAYGEKPKDYGTDVYVRKASDFIRHATRDTTPFFIYLSLYAPHRPAPPAPRHTQMFLDVQAPRTPSYNEEDVSDKPNYIQQEPLLNRQKQERIDALYQKRLQSLQAVDEGLAILIDTLKETNQLENTYIVFTSDNGYHLGQHRLAIGKETAYEEDIHVPLIVRGPHVPAGMIFPQLIGNTDLAPTFADWAGAPVPDFVDGRSFAPLLQSNIPTSKGWRQAYLVEHWEAKDQTESSEEDPSLTRGRVIPEFHGIRTQDYLYVEYSTGERELYDLKQDPAELQNIISTANPALVKQLADRLAELRSCNGAACRAAEDAPLTQ